MKGFLMKKTNWWWLSAAVSTVFVIALITLWIEMNKHEVASTQLVDEHAVNEYLKNNLENLQTRPILRVKTGIFVQSLELSNASEAYLTGYIWQRYQDGIHDNIKPGPSDVGFILPEQVNLGGDITPQMVYRLRTGDEEVIGWYFEATLRQPFDYSQYPFDHKTIRVRLRAKDFSQNIVLVPDFQAYQSTGLHDIFGIQKEIVLGTWVRKNTYFDYKLVNYGTDFGIAKYIGQSRLPEMHYNFVVKRKFENAFIIHLLPLFLVAILLFIALLTVSDKEEPSSRPGFSTSGFIAASAALFFVVMLAHINLREQFAGASIMYIDYFYILMYASVVVAAVNTYLFSIRTPPWSRFIIYEDNIIPKVAYWPVIFGILIIITLVVM